MAERVSKLAALVDGPRRRGRDMAGYAPWKGELREQLFQPGFILADVRINLAVAAFEVSIRHQCRAAMTGTGDVEHVQIMLFDDPVQMHIDEVLARRRAPVSDHQRLHVRRASAARARADCRRDKSARRTDNWPPANRRSSCAIRREPGALPLSAPHLRRSGSEALALKWVRSWL